MLKQRPGQLATFCFCRQKALVYFSAFVKICPRVGGGVGEGTSTGLSELGLAQNASLGGMNDFWRLLPAGESFNGLEVCFLPLS